MVGNIAEKFAVNEDHYQSRLKLKQIDQKPTCSACQVSRTVAHKHHCHHSEALKKAEHQPVQPIDNLL
ncbi:hypothetical protein RB195_006686 [Necator americanus]|uniref:Uncharacterized protein n=1 Tax=Necator americanus TaxID=51031 RepID=A0ABR1BTR9_NECAM